MAKLVFGMNLSLDGHVDHDAFAPDSTLFLHWIGQVRGATASIYGRRIMRYWEEDRPGAGRQRLSRERPPVLWQAGKADAARPS